MTHTFFSNGENGDEYKSVSSKYGKRHYVLQAIDSITMLPYNVLFLLWFGMALGFGMFYFLLGEVPGHGPEQIEGTAALPRLFNSLYYSVITATSTGYGDITPMGFSKFLAGVQSIFSLFIFAIFVTKLVSRRQDIALRQIHKLTFEDAFHNVREGFYIVRQDCDRIIAKASTMHTLDEHDWENITTAFRQAQSVLRRIPDFYDAQNRLYSLDVRREELLQEGLHRTLQRFDHMSDVLSSKHIHWTAHNEVVEELKEFLQIVNKVTHFWMRQSNYKKMQSFEDLLNMNEEIQKKVEHTVAKNGNG